MKKIVVAPDSFKGSLTSAEVADAVERGIKDVFPQCNVVKAGVPKTGFSFPLRKTAMRNL